jgi:hypothetical protein
MLPSGMTNLRAAVMLSASAPEPRLQQKNIDKRNEKASIADLDPYVFGSPGSGSELFVREVQIQILQSSSKNS